jgi:hypothetical protein
MMNPILYLAGLVGGTALASVGAGLQFGGSVGLMVAGAMSCGLALATAYLLTRGAA